MENANKHFLQIAHDAMERNRLGHLWLPGSTTWRHYGYLHHTGAMRPSIQSIRQAQRDGYLTKETGIPALTMEGYHKF